MIKRSAGNNSVGEMWTETKSFNYDQTLSDIYAWARGVCGVIDDIQISANVILSIDQSENANETQT